MYIIVCTLDNLGPQYLSSLMTSLLQVSKYLNNLKQTDKLVNFNPTLIKSVCSLIEVLSKSELKKNDFKLVFGVSSFKYFSYLILNKKEKKQIVVNINSTHIFQII